MSPAGKPPQAKGAPQALVEKVGEERGGELAAREAARRQAEDRLRGLQRVLDLGAQRGLQVIVLTCDPVAYDTLGVEIKEIQRQGGMA